MWDDVYYTVDWWTVAAVLSGILVTVIALAIVLTVRGSKWRP